VLEQWIYLHHQNDQTLQNYAWLDFKKITFEIAQWDIQQLLKLNLVPMFENMRIGYDSPFERLPASEAPYWQANGTWQVPPIILDVATLPHSRPKKAELHGPFQLVEGHSRFRNLLISEYQQLYLTSHHRIYLMKSVALPV
jgi:hypothetical protein